MLPEKLLSESPVTYLDFQRMFPDEAACFLYLEKMRWPSGFVCEKCSTIGEPFKFAARPHVLKCRVCHQDASITAGTVMHRSKTSVHFGSGQPILLQHRPLVFQHWSSKKD